MLWLQVGKLVLISTCVRCCEFCAMLPCGQTDPNTAASDHWSPHQQGSLHIHYKQRENPSNPPEGRALL